MRLALLACLAACSFHPGTAAVGSANGSDGGPPPEAMLIDARVDAAAAMDARRDASVGTSCDPVACTQKSGVCMSGACVITVTASGVTPTCPDGMPCVVNCASGSACKNAVTCGNATSCTINCMVQNSCQGGTMTCSHGCLVQCEADDTCWNTHYTCGTGSAACTLECCSTEACGTGNTFSGTDNLDQPGTCQ